MVSTRDIQQLILWFLNTKPIGRCQHSAVLQSIHCSPECKITVNKVPDTDDTIKFLLDTEQFIYTMDMFRDTLQLPVETSENPFVSLANIHTIEAFMKKVGYQGVVDKVSAFFTKNLAQPWNTMFKVFNRCLTTRTSGHDQTKINSLQLFHVVINQTLVDYAALLWWDFIDNVFQKKEVIQYLADTSLLILRICEELYQKFPPTFLRGETNDFKEYETVFMKVAVPMNQSQPVVSTQGTNRNTPRAHRSPTVLLNPWRNEEELKSQEKLDEEEIDKMVEGNTYEESYASEFANSILNDEGADVDDIGSKIEPGSQKENLERVSDDDETEKEKEVAQDMNVKETEEVGKEHNIVEKEVEDETNVEAEKTEEVVKEIEVADVSVSEDLTDKISPTTATTSRTSFTTKHKKRSFTFKTRNLPGSIAGMGRRRNLIRSHIKNKFITREFFAKKIQEVLKHCDTIVPELTVAKTNEMLFCVGIVWDWWGGGKIEGSRKSTPVDYILDVQYQLNTSSLQERRTVSNVRKSGCMYLRHYHDVLYMSVEYVACGIAFDLSSGILLPPSGNSTLNGVRDITNIMDESVFVTSSNTFGFAAELAFSLPERLNADNTDSTLSSRISWVDPPVLAG
ncbi:hypothetical protein Tco_0451533 [Tanacetum coccineum]